MVACLKTKKKKVLHSCNYHNCTGPEFHNSIPSIVDPEYEPDVEDSPSLEWDDKPTTVTEGSPPAADDPQLQPSWPPAQQQTRLRQQSLVQLSQSFEQIPSSPPLKAINNASDANQTVMKDKDPLNEETDSPSMEGDGNPPVIEKGNSFVVNERQFKATTV